MELLLFILSFTTVSAALLFLAGRWFYETFIKPKPKPHKYQSTIKQYKRIPKVDGDKIIWRKADGTQYVIAVVIFLLVAATGKAQFNIAGGAGMTNKYFSAELQVGYRLHSTVIQAGYISIPKDDQPVLFNLRIGQVIQERWLLYGGYVREQMSVDQKWRNHHRWQVGAQYHMLHYDRGTVYVAANYTSGARVSGHVGMSFNLMKAD